MKILGKYEIIEQFSSDEFRARDLHKNYFIKRVRKEGLDETMHSHLAQNLQDFRHKNLINISIDEDDEFFYAIREDFEREEYRPLSPEIFKNSDEVDYTRLLECYLQIFDAISYIHSKGLYHGNISTNKILVTRDNRVFLLDFGKSYFYALLGDDEKHFKAPEQLAEIKADIDIMADIFSFGLCMLNLLLGTFEDFEFNKNYKNPSDLENIYEKIQNDYDLESSENEIFLLIRKMTALNPQDRISLDDLGKELRAILRQNKQTYKFELNLSNSVEEKYREIHELSVYELKEHIQSRIEGKKSFWEFGLDKNKDREEIKIACGDLIFCCSAKDSSYLFCFSILENQKMLENLYANGLEFDNDFIITTGHNHSYECDNIQNIKDELKRDFEMQKLRNRGLETDRKAIATEEELLRAEKETIDLKKNVILAQFKSVNKGKDTMTFERIEIDKCSQKDREKFTEILKTAQNNQFTKTKKGKKPRDLTKVRDFQSTDKVIIQSIEPDLSVELKGEVSSLNLAKKEIIVQLDKYKDVNQNTLQNAILTIAYDYQMEEILWSKKDKALSDLKEAKTQIPNLLRKINEPKELRENVLVEIPSFFDENLDENQQEAVIKTLSLDSDSEILLIQGPPGTGKTTTITEMIRQIQKRHRHAKILVASQSNQAVDNVLEKICINEDKILRIGNDESKMSDIAKQFIPNKVLDRLIKDNRARIKANPISDENPSIETKLQELQGDFDKALQTITAKMSAKTGEKSKESELATLFLKNIRVIFGTLLGISSRKDFRDIVFDFAIVDEAGRATLSELCVPCIKARHIVLVGDHKQLAPVIDDEIASNLNSNFPKKEVGTSFFERYFERLSEKKAEVPYLENFRHRLIYNYRAEHKICELYNQPFYEGELKEALAIKGKREHNLSPLFKSSAVWIDTSKRDDREDTQAGTGKINHCNASIISSTLKILLDKSKEQNLSHSIGIITPYRAQTNLLKDKLKGIKAEFKELYADKASNDKDLRNGFDIGTVDSFQGSDRDIIIYDCVRSSKAKNSKEDREKRSGGKIDFIADEKRLNVSLSRAKKLLIIVGDMEFLYRASVSEGINPFYKIIDFIHKHKEDYHIIPAPQTQNKGGKNG
ncbi:AAA domain-containing protein [Helicobacter macacae]|uniref:Protein kinase domain-containing protein n=1 Tax=Helicobacter macacae MIT 99-5501 TaxID=1357400 RepID=V8CDA1_9HELI|nr:AAA domain-containing protein [Helicobacter macacae]ETD24975.1 hypothetical protein HMPREF2086_00310 [Helicobacter macacae MIT 99-5501]